MQYVAPRTAGSPTAEAVKWTDLRPCDIALHLRETYQVEVSHGCIKRVLQGNGYTYRKPAKTLATGVSPDRNEQCAHCVVFDRVVYGDGE